jgi:hypothetical protein
VRTAIGGLHVYVNLMLNYLPPKVMTMSGYRGTVGKRTSHGLPLWGDLTRCTEEHLARGTLSIPYPSLQVAGPGYSTFQLIYF